MLPQKVSKGVKRCQVNITTKPSCQIFIFINILVVKFCSNLSFWVLSKLKFLSFVTFWVVEFCNFFGFEFCQILIYNFEKQLNCKLCHIFVFFLVFEHFYFEFCYISSFWVLSQVEFLNFVTFSLFDFCHI